MPFARPVQTRHLVVVLAITLVLGASAVAAPPDRVLFIGNSLTYWNDLPLLVEAMAAHRGVALVCESVTRADAALEDHWGPSIRDVIRKGAFKFVVLQQGPSSMPAMIRSRPTRVSPL